MKSSLLPPTGQCRTPPPNLHQNVLSTTPTNSPATLSSLRKVVYSLRRFLCTTSVCKWIYYHTASYVLTHHSGVCRPGQIAPLEPSISPGDDPEDKDRRKGQVKSRQNSPKDASQKSPDWIFITAEESRYSGKRPICLLKTWGMRHGRSVSQRSIYIVKAKELINRIQDKV